MSPSVVLSNVEDGGLRDTALRCADGTSTRPYQLAWACDSLQGRAHFSDSHIAE